MPQQVALIYAGLICQSSANWILSDSVLKPDYVAERISLLSTKLLQSLADTTLESVPGMGFHIACSSVPNGGDWRRVLSSRLPSSVAGHPLCVTVNRIHSTIRKTSTAVSAKPELAPLPSDISGVEAFCQRLESVITLPTTPLPTCQPASKDKDSSIRIRRPCLYIFPEGSGQSAIFALPGFTLMVNAGSSRDPKCWKMAQYFETIDAILHTHWGAENIIGLASLLPALMASSDGTSAQPKVTFLLTPPPGHVITQPLSPPPPPPSDPLVLNVAALTNELAQVVKPFVAEHRLFAREVTRGAKLNAMPKPVHLFYKVGYGSLEFYPLTPAEDDQTDVKKLTELWAKAAPNVASSLAGSMKGPSTVKHDALSLVSQLSVSGLLIWKPDRKHDSLIRILFVAPNAHQLRVLSALEALHLGLPFIRTADPDAASSSASTGGVPSGTRKPNSARAHIRTTRPETAVSARSTVPARVPTANSKSSASSIPARPAKTTVPTAHTKLTKPAPKSKESTEQKTKTLKREPPTKAPKDEKLKAEKLEKKESEKNVISASGPPVPAVGTPPSTDLSPEVNPSSPSPMDWGHEDNSAKEMNGGDNFPVSPVKSLKEESFVDGDQHASAEAPESPSAAAAEPLNPLEDWGQPQAMPAPDAKGVKPSSASKTASPSFPPLEGYYEASAGATKGLIDKLSKHTFVDVAFLPGGGDVALVDAEFFKRVLARYYIATTAAPTADLLKAMAVGRVASIADSSVGDNHEVSLILAHDTPGLLEWAALNEKRLMDAKIDLMTVAERSTIKVVTAEGTDTGDLSCPGFRLDF
ncbi:hypothetical protein Aperf_G00000077547 [Anoplocephala perfoliata]